MQEPCPQAKANPRCHDRHLRWFTRPPPGGLGAPRPCCALVRLEEANSPPGKRARTTPDIAPAFILRRWCRQMLAPPHSLHVLLWRWCWKMLAPPHSLHLLLSRWCGHTLRGFFSFEAPAPASSASSRFRRLRVLLLPTCAVSSGTALCVLSPSSFSPPTAPPFAPRPPTPSSMASLSTVGRFSQLPQIICRRHAKGARQRRLTGHCLEAAGAQGVSVEE